MRSFFLGSVVAGFAVTLALAIGACGSVDGAPAGSTSSSSGGASSSGASGGSSGGGLADAQVDGGSVDGAADDADAFVENCLTGGSAAAGVTGAGTCADPFVVDLSAAALGTVASHLATSFGDEAAFTGACAATLGTTNRDVVYHLKMPAGVSSLEIGVDSPNVRLGVAEGPSCSQPVNACTDAATGSCRTLTAPKGAGGFSGSEAHVVVSEVEGSGQNLTVRFRAD